MINTNISKHIINIKTLTIYLEVCQQNQGSADNEIQTKRFNTSNVHINGQMIQNLNVQLKEVLFRFNIQNLYGNNGVHNYVLQ